MRICLVRPMHHSHLIQPPLALGYLSSYLKQHGHQTKVLDGLLLEIDNDALAARCAEADLVGISVLSDYFPQTVDLVGKLKRQGLPVVIGGPHATFTAHKTLEQTGADGQAISDAYAAE